MTDSIRDEREEMPLEYRRAEAVIEALGGTMSAQEVMARAISKCWYEGAENDRLFTVDILAALHAAGYRVVGPEHMEAMVDAGQRALAVDHRIPQDAPAWRWGSVHSDARVALTAALGAVNV